VLTVPEKIAVLNEKLVIVDIVDLLFEIVLVDVVVLLAVSDDEKLDSNEIGCGNELEKALDREEEVDRELKAEDIVGLEVVTNELLLDEVVDVRLLCGNVDWGILENTGSMMGLLVDDIEESDKDEVVIAELMLEIADGAELLWAVVEDRILENTGSTMGLLVAESNELLCDDVNCGMLENNGSTIGLLVAEKDDVVDVDILLDWIGCEELVRDDKDNKLLDVTGAVDGIVVDGTCSEKVVCSVVDPKLLGETKVDDEETLGVPGSSHGSVDSKSAAT
jgi:hypothetical protein